MNYIAEKFELTKKLVKEKYQSDAFLDLVSGISTPTLREMQRIRKKKFGLNEGESLDDRCFNLYLKRKPTFNWWISRYSSWMS